MSVKMLENVRTERKTRFLLNIFTTQGTWPPKVRFYRQYTNDNLWAALMEVKQGGSVYGASKQHGIPRKTLRNWMKRWNIQSSYQASLKKRAVGRNNFAQSFNAATVQGSAKAHGTTRGGGKQ